MAEDDPVRAIEELLRQVSSPAEMERARQTLLAWVEEWKALDYGLEDPFDTRMTLASVEALVVLQSSSELAELNEHIEARLAFEEEPPPDLALALAWTWQALLGPTMPRPSRERIADGLPLAIRYARAIAPEMGRDGLGCLLATELSRVQRKEGGEGPWLDAWLAELDRFGNDPNYRPYFLVDAADQLRIHGRYGEAAQRLAEIEAVLARRVDDSSAAGLEAVFASVRFNLEIVLGREDEAEASLRRQSDAARRSGQPSHRLDALQNSAALTMVSSNPQRMERELARLDEALEDDDLFRNHAAVRANLFARRAVGQQLLEERTSPEERKGKVMLEKALDDPDLESPYAQGVLLRLVADAERTNDLALARARLAQLEELEKQAPLVLEHRLNATAWKACIAMASDAPRSEREIHLGRLREAFADLIETAIASPLHEEGTGFLDLRNRRFLVGTFVELALQLEANSSAGRERVLDELLALESAGSMARRLGAPRANVASLRSELLPEETGLLLYVPSREGMHAFAVDASQVVHFKIPWNYEQEPQRKLVEAALANSPAVLTPGAREQELRRLESAFVALSGTLLAEVGTLIRGWKGLYVVGDDLLGGVPFECLSVHEKPLGLTHAVAHLPSISVGLALACRRAHPEAVREGALLLGAPRVAPVLSAENPELREFPLETSELLASFESSRPPLLGKNASFAGLLQELREHPPKILTFITHGLPAAKLTTAALVLAPDEADPLGLVTGEELIAAPFQAPPLVVLGACRSASERRRIGDDVPGELGAALLSKGTACTIQAGTAIALEPTVELITELLNGIDDGIAPAEALRLAREKLSQDREFAHPFYAMSLRVVGLGLEPLFKAEGR